MSWGHVALWALLLSACSLGQQPPQPALYDLGPVPAAASKSSPVELQLIDIAAPTWLGGTGIAYRLDYADPYRREIYRDSRWVAPPAALLAERLRQRSAAGGRAEKRLPLRLELVECLQVFTAANEAQQRLVLRAWLGEGAQALGPRVFEITHPVAPNAAGAVQGLAAASGALFEQLQAWAAEAK